MANESHSRQSSFPRHAGSTYRNSNSNKREFNGGSQRFARNLEALSSETAKGLARQAIARHHPLLTEEMFDVGVTDFMNRLGEVELRALFEELMNADLSMVSFPSATRPHLAPVYVLTTQLHGVHSY